MNVLNIFSIIILTIIVVVYIATIYIRIYLRFFNFVVYLDIFDRNIGIFFQVVHI